MRRVPEGLRKIDVMHHLFGKVEGKRCADCPHLCKNVYNRTYYKCDCYGQSNSVATDWAKSWTACGLIDGDHWQMYNIRSRDGTVINMLKHESIKKPLEECDGQISMDDLIKEA